MEKLQNMNIDAQSQYEVCLKIGTIKKIDIIDILETN